MKNEFPDLIITDLWMPGMGGIELIKETKSITKLKSVPIAIFSAKPVQEYEAKVKDTGKVAYIKKTATLEGIISVINALIQKELSLASPNYLPRYVASKNPNRYCR